ncbi:MAG: glycosyltransferase, partial [Limosilactobacillus sp.]
KERILAHLNGTRLYYVDYRDKFGFTDRRDYYDNGCLTYSEFFEDRARIVTRQYYDAQGRPKILYHYRGGDGNVPVLCLIQLHDNGQLWEFDSEDELRAHFMDQLAGSDKRAIFISDRSDYTLKAFALMNEDVPRYQFFHSAFTENGQPTGKLFAVYEPIKQELANHHLAGLISSTQQEAADASKRFATTASYGIPVTYIPDAQLQKKIPFSQRIPGQLIAVARLTNVKRLNHLINTVIMLRKKHPNVDLKIYGYDDGWNNYATSHELRKLVQDNNAADYIHFCGYQHDLTKVYETAQIEVLTSSYEGFAMALLEAQGHGCPAVSYDINYGPAEIIKDQVSGRLLPAGDVHALYTVLDELLSNLQTLESYANHAQEAAARYSFENVAAQWKSFIAADKNIQRVLAD